MALTIRYSMHVLTPETRAGFHRAPGPFVQEVHSLRSVGGGLRHRALDGGRYLVFAGDDIVDLKHVVMYVIAKCRHRNAFVHVIAPKNV